MNSIPSPRLRGRRAAGGALARMTGAHASSLVVRRRRGAVQRGAAAVAALAADRDSAGARRRLQIALAVTWLLDAALQYQPFMFGNGFVAQVLRPAQAGNPHLFAGPATAAARLISSDLVVTNAAFATIQLVLAAGLLWRRTVRAALVVSIAWSLAVWWLGEGAGGVVTGSATPVTGAPGAVILYAFLAVLVWPAPTRDDDSAGASVAGANWAGASVAATSPAGTWWSRAGWLALWGSSAYLVLQPVNREPQALHDAIASMADGEPGWVAAMDHRAAAAAASNGLLAAVILAVVFTLIAAGIFHRLTVRPALVLAVAAALVIWVLGENFGAILTGHGTDPNTGPLLILLAAAFWPRTAARTSPRAAGRRHAAARR